MSLISILTVRIGKRRSVRNLLSGFGVLQWCTFSVFLAKLHHHRNHRFATQLDSQRNSAWWNSNLSNLGRLHWWCIPTLASLTQGGLYVERIQKRQDLKNKALYCWQEDTTFATLSREKIERSIRDADHFKAIQEPCQLPAEEINHQCITRRSGRKRPVPYIVEKVACSQD